LLLVIVFASWVNISNFQNVRKESLRRAALEKAAGMLDFVSRVDVNPSPVRHGVPSEGFYRVYFDGGAGTGTYELEAAGSIPLAMFREKDPIGYTLEVKERSPPDDFAKAGWPANRSWAEIGLYDQHGVRSGPQNRPFCRLAVYLMEE